MILYFLGKNCMIQRIFLLMFLLLAFSSCSIVEKQAWEEKIVQPEVIQTVQTHTEKVNKNQEVKVKMHFSLPNIENQNLQSIISKWAQKLKEKVKIELLSSSIAYNEVQLIFDYQIFAGKWYTAIVYTVTEQKQGQVVRTIIQTFFVDSTWKILKNSDLLDTKKYGKKLAIILKNILKENEKVDVQELEKHIEVYVQDVQFYPIKDQLVFLFDGNSKILKYPTNYESVGIPFSSLKGMLVKQYMPNNRQIQAETDIDIQQIEKIKKDNNKVEKEPPLVQIIHTIAGWEHIQSVADRYGIDYKDIIELNHLEHPDDVEVGQKLKIPNPKNIIEKNTPTTIVSEKKPKKVEVQDERGKDIHSQMNNKPLTEGEKYVALTFDDGPNPKTTHPLLHLLKKRRVKATFYVLGQNVNRHPDTVLWAYNDGHEIANHTWSHPDLRYLSKEKILKEISLTDEWIKNATGGFVPTTIRPPYWAVDDKVKSVLSDKTIVMWNADSQDRKHRNVTKNLNQVLPEIQAGSIILFHDIHKPSVDTIDTLITTLEKQGYTFVTVSELLKKWQWASVIGKTCYSAYRCE